MKVLAAIRLLAGLSPALLSACASWGSYRQAVRALDDGRYPAYYRANAAPPAAPSAPPSLAPDAAAASTGQALREQFRRWEALLAQEPAAPTARNFLPAPAPAVAALAHSPQLDERLAAGVSLDLLLGLARERNPALQAAAANRRAALEAYPQAAYLDDILRQYSAFNKQLESAVGPAPDGSMMAMNFPFPAIATLKAQAATQDAEAAGLDEEIAARDLATQVRLDFYQYQWLDQALALGRAERALMAQTSGSAAGLSRTGQGRYQDLALAQVDLAKLDNELATLAQERRSVQARLNARLDRPPAAPLGPPAPLVPPPPLPPALAALETWALAQRQEVRQQRLNLARMQTMLAMTRRMSRPGASLGASYFEDRMRLSSGSGEAPLAGGGMAGAGPGPGPAVPPFLTRRDLDLRQAAGFGSSDAYARELAERSRGMERMVLAMENDTRAMLHDLHGAWANADRSLRLARETTIPQARQAAAAATAAYRAGNGDFLAALAAQRDLLRRQLDEAQAARDGLVQSARLEQVLGRPLPAR